jgi:hypothetical protein
MAQQQRLHDGYDESGAGSGNDKLKQVEHRRLHRSRAQLPEPLGIDDGARSTWIHRRKSLVRVRRSAPMPL